MITNTEIAMIALIVVNLGGVLTLLFRGGQASQARARIRVPAGAEPSAAARPEAEARPNTAPSSGDDRRIPDVLAALVRKVEIEESRGAARAMTSRQRWQALSRGGESLPGAAGSCRSAATGAPVTRGSGPWHVT